MRTCSTPDCGKKVRAKGLCITCYNRANRHLWSSMRYVSSRPCDFPACDRPHYCKGYCAGHYQQLRRGYELQPLGWMGRGRAKGAPRSQPVKRATPAKVSPLPKGWNKTTKTVPDRVSGLGSNFLPEIPPVPETSPEIVAKAARTLMLMGADDLAEMLGMVA